MATAYRLNTDSSGNMGSISASRSNDGSRVSVWLNDENGTPIDSLSFDTADFLKYMTTLLKNWGK